MSINLRDNSTKSCVDLMVQENPSFSSFIAAYPEDQLEKILANQDKLKKVIDTFTNVSRGGTIAAMIMVCDTNTCPYRQICVLLKSGLAPTSGSCPVEKKMIMELESEIITSLHIDTNDPIEMELLWDLIDTKLLDLRSSALLRNGELTNTLVTRGNEMESTKIELKPELFAKIELKKIKHSIIDSFVATRRAKKKYGTNLGSNALEDLLKKAASKAIISND